MDFERYKSWVRTRVNVTRATIIDAEPADNNTELTLAAMGLAGETGEVVDLLKKILFHGKPFTMELQEKLKLEMGDVLWYFALLADLQGFTLADIMDANVVKLTARDGVHGENFHAARAS